MGTKWLNWLGVGLVISRSLVQFSAGALWSVLGQDSLFHIVQSTQLQNGYLASIRQCLELVRFTLPVALKYPLGIEMVSVCTGLLGEQGRVSALVNTRL